MSQSLSYSCALVTGASSGLGEEFAMQLAAQVKHLVLVARRAALLEDLALRIRQSFPLVTVSVHATDLADADERDRLIRSLDEQGHVPDLLVNNAGLGDYGDFAEAEWPKLEMMLRVNVEALTHLAHALVPGMIRGGRGAVVNVSSLASLLPIPDFAVYAASKAYVTSFSESLRIELRRHAIPVLAVCPGPVHTNFGKVAQREEHVPGMPVREWFYVPCEQVVRESLTALGQDKARIYPALKTAVAALAISAVPIILMRVVMGSRPRKG